MIDRPAEALGEALLLLQVTCVLRKYKKRRLE